MTVGRRDERAALLMLLRRQTRGDGGWSAVTEQVLDHGSALEVMDRIGEDSLIPDPDVELQYKAALHDVDQWLDAGLQILTITDPLYPSRVKAIHQAPPFLFWQGSLVENDRGVAVVGSRSASPRGAAMASEAARGLVEAGLTVVSGLAVGIDAAAHTAALEAGGRTVALIATGINRHYPAANRELQDAIARRGLVLSQFLPDAPPQKHNFLMRNAVMSGYGYATVVVEAGEYSGARAQARMAVEHGRPVILSTHVIRGNEWARSMQDRPGVHVADSVDDVLAIVTSVLGRDRATEDLMFQLRHLSAG